MYFQRFTRPWLGLGSLRISINVLGLLAEKPPLRLASERVTEEWRGEYPLQGLAEPRRAVAVG